MTACDSRAARDSLRRDLGRRACPRAVADDGEFRPLGRDWRRTYVDLDVVRPTTRCFTPVLMRRRWGHGGRRIAPRRCMSSAGAPRSRGRPHEYAILIHQQAGTMIARDGRETRLCLAPPPSWMTRPYTFHATDQSADRAALSATRSRPACARCGRHCRVRGRYAHRRVVYRSPPWRASACCLAPDEAEAVSRHTLDLAATTLEATPKRAAPFSRGLRCSRASTPISATTSPIPPRPSQCRCGPRYFRVHVHRLFHETEIPSLARSGGIV